MSVRVEPKPVVASAASPAGAAVAVPVTCWWHGRVHHYGH